MPKYTYELPKHKITPKIVDPDDITVDERYQRNLNQGRADKIAEGLVETALGTIVLSQREPGGPLYCVDGWHRVNACKQRGVTRIHAEIHHGLTEAQEAVLYLIKNREQHRTTPLEEYKAGVRSGVKLFTDTDEVLTKHELTMGSGASANQVRAVAGVVGIVEKFDPETLDRALTVAEAAWGRTAATWDGMLLSGLGLFLGRHGDGIDDEKLISKLAHKGSATQWVSSIVWEATKGGKTPSGTGGRSSAAYALIKECWNSGRRKSRIE